MTEVSTDDITTVPLFKNLFPADEKIKDSIKESMMKDGFDKSKPIDIWNGVCIDGHTRLAAAKEVGIKVEVFKHNFANDDEALEYAIHNQRDRRNLTSADIVRCVGMLDKRATKSEAGAMKGKLTSHDVSSKKTADVIGTSQATVERTRTIIDYGSEEDVKKINGGDSINKVYKEVQEKRKQEYKSVFNKTNENIEWAKWTWNPVTGCKRGCKYCYARDIANRFNSNGFIPTFHKERLDAPTNTMMPKAAEHDIGYKNVFVCSMADLFGEWVNHEWIDDVMKTVRSNPQWNFLFLTKSPERLVGIEWPDNAWVGTTVDIQSRVKPAEDSFRKINATVKFVSCEPLLEKITFNDVSVFDWVIIGGQSKTSGCEEFQPKWKWVEDIMKQARSGGCKIYLKPNLTIRPREYPHHSPNGHKET